MRTPHLLLDTRAGWLAAALQDAVAGARLELQAVPDAPPQLAEPSGSFAGLSSPTGMAVDPGGGVYVLDAGLLALFRADVCSGELVPLPCFGGEGRAPRRLLEPRGLDVSRRFDAYVVDGGNRRVQVLALNGLALRAVLGPLRVVRTEAGVAVEPAAAAPPAPAEEAGDCASAPVFPEHTWDPWDVVVARDCTVYVSDRGESLVHVFDSGGRWRRAFERESEARPLERPTALALDRSGRLYVAQEGKDYVVVLAPDGTFLRRVRRPPEVAGAFAPVSLAVDADGNLWLGDAGSGLLHIYRPRDTEGHLAYAGACRGFAGSATGVVFTGAAALVADARSGSVVRVVADAAYASAGIYWSSALDSELYRCEWNRVVLDADVPEGTQVTVHTLTSEIEKDAAEVRALPDERWATAQVDTGVDGRTWDCLVTGPPGRYLWLRLTLSGDGDRTPSIERVKVFYPRRSSLDFLPAVYRDDVLAADFTARFLSIFDEIRDEIGDTIDGIARTFDPRATPAGEDGEPDFLSWLAGWLDLSLDASWSVETRRRLVENAHRLYALRGTPEGLRLHLELYAGTKPTLLEHFTLRRLLFAGHGRLGDCARLWGPALSGRFQLDEGPAVDEIQLLDDDDPRADPLALQAHRFSVFVAPSAVATDSGQRAIDRIIEQAKPAHTVATLEVLDPGLRVGAQGFVGVDTVIGRYPDRVVVGGDEPLGRGTVLGAAPDETAPPTLRVGRARIGSMTVLD